jgi:hypothetical protein
VGSQLGRELAPGTFGDNLTLEGIDVSGARIGERWRAGTVELRVAGPRVPCQKLATRIGDPCFVRRFALALEVLLLAPQRLVELEPARPDMLPKLAGWVEARRGRRAARGAT